MKVITNILISVLSFAISYGIAHLTGSVIVKNAVLLAYVIHWIAYLPAYVFQTEKFYDLTGSVTYLSVVWFVFLSTYCLLYTSPSPRDLSTSRMPSSA